MTKKLKHVNKLHHLGHHMELGQEATSKKAHAFAEHLAEVSQLHSSESEPKQEKTLIQPLETPPNNLNHQSTVSKSLSSSSHQQPKF
jgi:hypothetical protein